MIEREKLSMRKNKKEESAGPGTDLVQGGGEGGIEDTHPHPRHLACLSVGEGCCS